MDVSPVSMLIAALVALATLALAVLAVRAATRLVVGLARRHTGMGGRRRFSASVVEGAQRSAGRRQRNAARRAGR